MALGQPNDGFGIPSADWRGYAREKVKAIGSICALTEVQKQKLELAARGDVKRLLDRLEELRERFQSYYVVDVGDIRSLGRELGRETEPVRSKLHSDPFDEGSLFAKTLTKILTPEQAVKYDERRSNRRRAPDQLLPELRFGS